MKTILCIDDDAKLLQMMKEVLSTRGYRVLVTTSTNAGPSCLKFETVDLVLLDLNMPTKHGLAVYREIGVESHVPVLFVTGSRNVDPHSESFKQEYQKELAGIRTDILHKPFVVAELYEKIESLIGCGKN
jgi:two-component system OmpR family response regulator